MVGKAITSLLSKNGYHVIILTRDAKGKRSQKGITYAEWDVKAQQIDLSAVAAADHIIHLAGAGVVEKKWTKSYKEEIVDSRVNSSALLIKALREHPNKVQSIISASAIGWYGPDQPGKPAFTESDPPDHNFLGETCRLWEESVEPATALGKRVVKLRIGIVLSNDGGAFAEFKKTLKFGISSILGNGKQIVSWIHIDDLCRIFMKALEDQSMQGSYNAVAPEPVSNEDLNLVLAKAVRKRKRFISMHVPSFVLKLMLGQRSIEVLKSAAVSSKKIEATGFTFEYPDIESAIADLVEKKSRS